MTHSEYHWKSADGLDIFAQSWMPGGKPKAIINLVHGLGDHSGRFAEWAAWFVEAGYGFLALDYRGHGRSGGKRGHAGSYELLMQDIDLLLSKCRELFPSVPEVLYGHSMGGNMVINYCIRYKPGIIALVATSPWLRLAFEPPRVTIFVGNLLKKMFPSMQNANGLVASQLSRDPGVGKLYTADPLVHNKISLSTFFAVTLAGKEAIQNSRRISVPFLLMHGSGDLITSHKASQDLVTTAGDTITFRLWDGCCHELHNETNKKEIFQFLLKWLEEQQSATEAGKDRNGYF